MIDPLQSACAMADCLATRASISRVIQWVFVMGKCSMWLCGHKLELMNRWCDKVFDPQTWDLGSSWVCASKINSYNNSLLHPILDIPPWLEELPHHISVNKTWRNHFSKLWSPFSSNLFKHIDDSFENFSNVLSVSRLISWFEDHIKL